MNPSIFNHYRVIVGYVYKKIFHEKMSADVDKFFKNVLYVGFGTFIAAILSFAFNVFSGRFLGPAEYGEFSLVQSIGMFLYIPMLMGYNNAMIKFNAEENNPDRQKELISTIYISVLAFTAVSICIYLLIPQKILEYFSMSSEVFHLSIFFAISFVFYTLTTSTLAGFQEMKKYSIISPIYSFISLLVFLFFIYFKFISYKAAVFSMSLAYIVSGGIILIFICKYFTFKFDKTLAHRLTNYGLNALIGGIAFVFYSNIDQIAINMYMSAGDVGLYKAYSSASMSIISIFFYIFNTVFFPVASKYKDKTVILKRIEKFTPYLFGCGIPFIIFSEFIILNLYGKAYTTDILLIITFAIVSILSVYYGIYVWTFNSEGIEGVRLVNKSTIIIAVINVPLDLCLIPYIGILGATISTAIAFSIGIFVLLKSRNLFVVPSLKYPTY